MPHLLLAYCGLKIDLNPHQNLGLVSLFPQNCGFSCAFKNDQALLNA